MTHGDTIVDGYGIELGCIATQCFNLAFHDLANLMQVCVAWYELCEGVGNGNDRLPHHFALHAVGNPKCAGARHAATLSAGSTSKWMFHVSFYLLLICCKTTRCMGGMQM